MKSFNIGVAFGTSCSLSPSIMFFQGGQFFLLEFLVELLAILNFLSLPHKNNIL